MKILVLNGPNLNLLGTREPEVYGSETLADLEVMIRVWAAELGHEVETYQSNHEGDLIDVIQQTDADGLVINPAAFTHTSRAIPDAISAVGIPAVEVHISNVKEREPWRAVSFFEEVCIATIYGRGQNGYKDAIETLGARSDS